MMNSVYEKLKDRYVSDRDDLLQDFYKPSFYISKTYKRMSGYFSSNLIKVITNELSSTSTFENIKIKIICSPELSNIDKLNIAKGYNIKNIIEENINMSIDNINNDMLPFISRLIVEGVIDFRFVTNRSGEGIFHSKEGIFIDYFGNRIAFTGSNNETLAAVKSNFEVTNVYKERYFRNLIDEIEKTFDDIWEGETESLVQIPITDKIFSKFNENLSFDFEKKNDNNINVSEKIELYPYQKEAIHQWENNDFNGLLEMATGTGKTITALAAYEYLSNKVSDILTVIVVPQIDLVNQWSEELKNFSANSINCSSSEKNWKNTLITEMNALKEGRKRRLFVIVTTETFKSKFFQNTLIKYKAKRNLIIADEVHSFGSVQTVNLYNTLEGIFDYKLGISATPFRKKEEESEKLVNFFNGIIYRYSLNDAIKNGYLNEYEYYPIILTFTHKELTQYREDLLNEFVEKNKISIDKIERLTSTIANASTTKINKLIEVVKEHGINNSKIVYCSPGNYNDGVNIQNEKHIHAVKKALANIENCKLRVINSGVSGEERSIILDYFKKGELNTLLAIKCLDQGVNIKNVTHAYILSSTDSLTEFVQRRGRILRTSPNKPVSKIYDFIILPQNYEDITFNPTIEDAYLVDRELRRMEEYNYASNNKEENLVKIEKIKEVYNDVLEEYYDSRR